MKIKHFLYNTFLIENGKTKIAIDPGALFFYYFRFTSLIPKSEWQDISHILVTHGDPDHYWHTDRVAKASNASVICNKTMVRNVEGKPLLLGPRDKGLAFTTAFYPAPHIYGNLDSCIIYIKCSTWNISTELEQILPFFSMKKCPGVPLFFLSLQNL